MNPGDRSRAKRAAAATLLSWPTASAAKPNRRRDAVAGFNRMEPAKEPGMCRLVRVGILVAACLIEPSFVSAAQPVDPPGPWRNWDLRDEDAVTEALSQATRLGDGKLAPDGVCTFTWADAPAGFHNLVAVARDTEGKCSCSNIARVSVGLKNLARGRAVQASSDAKNAPCAVDEDLFSAWSGDKKGEQWLTVDLGSEPKVGGAVVVWSKAYAKSFRVELSSDGATWKEVYRNEKKTDWRGDSDVIRFEPVKARHVRLLCSQPGTTWGGYVVYELGIYAAIPDAPQGK
jgi:hypothetical protein